MYLKSITLKGFKSFPTRTRLDFAPGVSVIVGPNGSGKSNIADGIVWALGEQSAGAVRGQSMQDLLFGGAPGIPSASSAEVEVVFDNSDGRLDSEFRELAIVRRVNREGEGEYRINGARCRLIDVIEVLADTGLGKEMHSVLSQGKVDHVVSSKPRDRRLLIEEAAGLGKHRKRRRRAQLKLARTRDNLDRVLDVEREARSRLKPLKRQAEAAETHERLERQANELLALVIGDRMRALEDELEQARKSAEAARAARADIERQLAEVASEREAAEREITAAAAQRELVASQLFEVRSACERIELRRERVAERARTLTAQQQRCRGELSQLKLDIVTEADDTRLAQLEQELARLDEQLRAELDAELSDLIQREVAAREAQLAADGRYEAARQAVADAELQVSQQRAAARESRTRLDDARRRRASLEGELSAVEEFLRESATRRRGGTLAEAIEVEPGFEQAVAAVLGQRLSAAVVDDLGAANELLDGCGDDGGAALVGRGAGVPVTAPPPGGEPLAAKLRANAAAQAVVATLLHDAWVVDDLTRLGEDFTGIAVTRAGRAWFGATGEVRQIAGGGEQRELTARNRCAQLHEELARATRELEVAEQALDGQHALIEQSEAGFEAAVDAAAAVRRERDEAAGAAGALVATIDKRREAGASDGPLAVKRAALEAEFRSEQAVAQRVAQAVEAQQRRRLQLAEELAAAEVALPRVEALASALNEAVAVARERVEEFAKRAEAGRGGAAAVTERLRALATRESELQAELHRAGDAVTTAEVAAQRAGDAHAEVTEEARCLTDALGSPVVAAAQALDVKHREEIETKLARIARRRELLGPINPLAQDEYAEALAHVEELERQRDDLEQALKELEELIHEVDRTIRRSFEETFESTAAHFGDLVARLFPGGTGELRLVREERAQAPALTVPNTDGEAGPEPGIADDELPEDPDQERDAADDYGVEIEVRLPGSKSGRRLSLLSGGERSLVALAFLFSVFLTRPCPFYVFDEAEAALDDINIDRLVALLREHSTQSQFIVITHQKRTMDAADQLYGVSMGTDGITKVVSRKLPHDDARDQQSLEPAAA